MSEGHDGFSGCTSSNFELLMESTRDVIDSIKELSENVEAKLHESASLDEIIPLLAEKRDRVSILRDLSREITVSLGAAGTGQVGIPLSETLKQQFVDLVSEFEELIAEEHSLETLVFKRGLRISGRKR